jgi:hypothetical protein
MNGNREKLRTKSKVLEIRQDLWENGSRQYQAFCLEGAAGYFIS